MAAVASTHLNSLDAVRRGPSIDVHSDDVPVDAIAIFFETLAACGLQEKEAAYFMAMDASQLSRVKNKTARLPFDAVWRLPDHFWIAFRDRIDAAKRLTNENRKAIQRARLLEVVSLLLQEVA